MAAGLGVIGMGASLIGGFMQAGAASAAGKAQQQMYQYQAQVARINADIDQQNARYAMGQGEVQAYQYGLKAAQQAGEIKVGQAASGLDVNSGSAVDVQRSQHNLALTDQAQIRANALKNAYDYRVKAAMDLNQANLDVMAGENAKKAGDNQAMASIIGAVGGVADKWFKGGVGGLF